MKRVEAEGQLREQWERMHMEVHSHEREARDKAEAAVNQRLDGMNELRAQINLERGNFLTREMYDREHKNLGNEVRVLQLKDSNMTGRLWSLGIGIGLIVVAINIAMHFWTK